MNPFLPLILLVTCTVLFSLAAGAALFFYLRYRHPEPSMLQQRLSGVKGKQNREEDEQEKEAVRKLARFYKEADYQNEALGRRLEQLAFFRRLKLRIQQAGMKTPSDRFLMQTMVLPSLVMSAIALATGWIPLLLLIPLIVIGAYMYVLFRRNRRYARFISQMPDALSMITSALRAGHSFHSSLSVVSTEMADPIATEFVAVVRDINLGIPVKEALNRLVNKLETLPDVRMFATAVMIQREAGGNLAEVLEKLGYTIRERFKLKGQISALTGQSRLTGYVLGAAPALILLFLSIFMYDYVKPLYETNLGHLALMAALFLQGIGFFIMKRIIDIKV